MKNNPLSRYKLKRLRKKKPELRLAIASDEEGDPCRALMERHFPLFSKLSADLYDEFWPQWRAHASVRCSLRFLTPERMARINGEYRRLNEPTDVLTFPLYERDGRFVPETLPLPMLLGDILLCSRVIAKNALEHGVSELSETALVFFHGMLHLLAWDHDTPERQSAMWSAQERYCGLLLSGARNTCGGVGGRSDG